MGEADDGCGAGTELELAATSGNDCCCGGCWRRRLAASRMWSRVNSENNVASILLGTQGGRSRERPVERIHASHASRQSMLPLEMIEATICLDIETTAPASTSALFVCDLMYL